LYSIYAWFTIHEAWQAANDSVCVEIYSNQIKSNLFANTKYERKKTDEKPEVNQNENNNYKLEC